MIEGLREERQLWGKELAHQGASLAQERGRLEAQLEFLTKETGSLRQQLERERDAVRIKEKQVEDQANSIQCLKRTLTQKERDLETGGQKLEKELRELRVRLEREEASNTDMQVGDTTCVFLLDYVPLLHHRIRLALCFRGRRS